MPIKFYDLEPDGANDSHYLVCNGVKIARFNDLMKAVSVRENFMRDVAATYEQSNDRLNDLHERSNGL